MVWLRFIVMCLLTLALPAQGLAAATMVYCQTASVPPSLASSASSEAVALHAEDCPGKGSAENKAGVKTACSVCAAACAMALPVTLPHLAEPEAAPVAFSAAVRPIAPYEAAGPDRPPRSGRSARSASSGPRA